MKEDKLLGDWQDEEGVEFSFDEKAARKMIRRTRLRIAVWAFGSVLGVWFLYAVYMMFVNVAFDGFDYQRKLERYVTSVVEYHNPGLRVEWNLAGSGKTEITPFFTQKTTLKLYRRIGDWNVNAGEVRAEKSLSGDLKYELDLQTKYLNQNNEFTFAVPLDLLDSTYQPMVKPENEVWERLGKIGDGYVAEMAFSTKKGMTAKELVSLLELYDLHVMKLAVFAGELKEIKQLTYFGSDGEYFVYPLMMRPYQEYASTHMPQEGALFLEKGAILERSEELFMQDLEWMIDNGSYYGKDLDGQRLAYLKKEGIKVYGAVVTGPVRELEKLRANEKLRSFQLGQVEFWNWRSK
jgi:hypothetical protein